MEFLTLHYSFLKYKGIFFLILEIKIKKKNSQPWDWIIWSMWHLSTATVNQVPLNYKNCQRNSKPNYSRRFGFGSVSCHATYDFSLDRSYVKSVSPFPNLIQLFHIHKLLSKLVCSFSLSSLYVNALISLLTLL